MYMYIYGKDIVRVKEEVLLSGWRGLLGFSLLISEAINLSRDLMSANWKLNARHVQSLVYVLCWEVLLIKGV